MQDENSVVMETRVKLTGHLPVKEFKLVQPLNALRLELGQIGFGFLLLGVVLLALGLQFLIIEGTFLEGILGRLELFVRLGFRQDGAFKFIFQQLLDFGAPLDLLLKPLDFGCMLFLPLRGLGLGGRELVFQLQVLKDEQLEKLATLVVRFLQNATREELNRSRGLASEFLATEEICKCKKGLGDCPSLPLWLSEIRRERELGD